MDSALLHNLMAGAGSTGQLISGLIVALLYVVYRPAQRDWKHSPSRRVYIPKPDGRQRPLAVAALEDKIVQRATAAVLNAIYEEDFLGFSYGFRPGRGTHDALNALCVAIERKKVNWILDADIRSFLDDASYYTPACAAWSKRSD